MDKLSKGDVDKIKNKIKEQKKKEEEYLKKDFKNKNSKIL